MQRRSRHSAAGSCRLRSGLLLLLSAIASFVLTGTLYAQQVLPAVTFVGAQTTLPTTGLNSPEGVAVDKAGDVFIADTNNNRVVEVPAGGGPQITLTANGLNEPTGVAVDAAGNVFIADGPINNRVVELPAGGGAQITVGTGLSDPYSVAVDSAGNLFIADMGNNRVVEVPVGGGAQATVPATGLAAPSGVAVDAAGDVFIVGEFNDVIEVPASGGAQVNIPVVGANFSDLGIAVDGAGDIFVSGEFFNGIVEIPAGGGAQVTLPITTQNPSSFQGLAVDGSDNLFVTNYDDNAVYKLQLNSVNFGSANVCPVGVGAPAPCNQTLTLNYNVNQSTTLGGINLGNNQDFISVDTGTTCIGAVTAGTTCAVEMTFNPEFAGPRTGAVEVTNANAAPIATTLISGTGLAPQVALLPGTQSTIQPATANQGIYGVAIGDNGTIYYSDQLGQKVYKVVNGVTTPLNFTNLAAPTQLAIDGSGAVYVLDGSDQILKLDASGNQTTLINFENFPDGMTSISAFALDGEGDVYFIGPSSDFGGLVAKISTAGNVSLLGTDYVDLQTIAISPSGVVAFIDLATSNAGATSTLYFISPAGQRSTVASIPAVITAIAVDAGGAVYLPEDSQTPPFNAGNLLVIDSLGIQSTYAVPGLDISNQLAMDNSGDLYFANEIGSQQQNPAGNILFINRALAPTINFGNVFLGTTSAPQAETVSNIGNQPLTIASIAYTSDAGGGFGELPQANSVPAECSTTAALAEGATCLIMSIFAPPTGAANAGFYTGAFTLTDNALNASAATPAMQAVSLEGSGTAPNTPVSMMLTGPVPTPIYEGQTGVYTVTELDATDNPAAGDNDVVNLTLTGPQEYNNLQATLANGQGTLNLTLQEAGNYTLTATDPANGLTQTLNFPVSMEPGPGPNFAAIALSASPTAPYYFDQVLVTATVNGTNTPPPIGTVTYTVDNGEMQVATLSSGGTGPPTNPTSATFPIGPLPVGAHSVSVTYSGDPTGFYSQSGPQILNITVTDPPLSLVSSERLQAFGNAGTPDGVAVDFAGNVYLADTTGVQVLEYLAAQPNAAPTVLPLTGLVKPNGLAVNANGTVYISDSGAEAVYSYSTATGQLLLPFTGLGAPGKVAVDVENDVFVADPNNNRVLELNFDYIQNTVPAIGLNAPQGVAVDAAGNIYIADTLNNRVVKIGTNQNQTTIFATPDPVAVTLDSQANVYVLSGAGGELLDVVTRIDAEGHQVQLNGVGYFNGFNLFPTDIAADGLGDLLVPGTQSVPVGNPITDVLVISTNPGIKVQDTMIAGTALSGIGNYLIPSSLEVAPGFSATDLAANAEFTPNQNLNCANSISTTGICTYTVTFNPVLPGVRTGSFTLSNANGTVLRTDAVYGNGLGPLVAFDQGLQTSQVNVTGLVNPAAVAVDGLGQVYVADSGNGSIFRIPVGGAPTVVLNGLVRPEGVAVDGIGNTYAVDSGGTRLVEVSPQGMVTNLATTAFNPATGIGLPGPLAVDGAGNVYVVTAGPLAAKGGGPVGHVVKVDPAGNVTNLTGNLISAPASVAVDSQGNVYFPPGDDTITEIAPNGVQTTIMTGFTPGALAVDAGGEIFVANTDAGSIVRIDSSGNQTTPITFGGAGPSGLALDGLGNLYFSTTNATVGELPRSSPSFPITAQLGGVAEIFFAVTNIGNQPLDFSAISIAAPFSPYSLQFPPYTACLAMTTLAAGTDCQVPVSFTPTAVGMVNGTATLVDNSLNNPNSNQTVALQGTGTAAAATLTTLALTATPIDGSFLGQPVTLTATLAPFAVGNVTTNGETITFQSNGVTLGTGVLAGGVATFTTNALPAGSNALTAVYSGDANFAASNANLNYTVNVPATTATVLVVTAGGNDVVTTVAAGTVVTLTAKVTVNGDFVSPGLVIFCDATAPRCENSAILGTAQLTTLGTATLVFVPGIGVHSYAAVFGGTYGVATSTSPAQTLTVTGVYPTTTTIQATPEAAGEYTLVGTTTAAALPTGSLSFLDTSNNGFSLGSELLVANGIATVNFANSATPATGNHPIAIVEADFDGNGTADLATVNELDNTLTILFGNGAGLFTPAAATPAAPGFPGAMVAADFNGDGKIDLAVTDTGNATLTILIGDGNGTFTPAASPATGANPQSIAVGDFNGDGRPDLAVTNGNDNTVSILLGAGDGTFTAAPLLTTGNFPYPIVAADFNGDGILDLAVVNYGDSTVTIFLGRGNGTFVALPTTVTTGAAPTGAAAGDLNEDGIPDLMVVNAESDTVTVLKGNGDGTFTALVNVQTGVEPINVAVGDFNNDGIPDLAVTNRTGNTVTVVLGNGDGTFTATPTSPAAGNETNGIVVADFNGDGINDIATSNQGSNNVTVLISQPQVSATATLADVTVPGTEIHNVEASFAANGNFGASVSPTTPLMGSQTATVLTLTASPASSFVGQAVTLTATLAPFNSGNVTTNGEIITFQNNGVTLGAGVLAGGVATLTTNALPVGSDALTAAYAGGANFVASNANLTYTVNAPATTAITLAVTAGGKAVTTVASGTAVTLTATVTSGNLPPPYNSAFPGLVTFCDATAARCENSAILGAAQLTTAGTATLKFTPGIGVHSYNTVFAGTKGDATSTSTAQPLTVSGTYPTTTTIAASGTPGNYTLTGIVVGTGGPYAQTSVFVVPTQPWTDTGISVTAGQVLAISATGELDWYTGGCSGQSCTNGPNGSNPPNPCPGIGAIAPNLVCYSLIGRIGTNGTPFQVGASLNIASPATGELYLGVNDGNFGDNTLGWTAFVNVNQAPTGNLSFLDTTNNGASLGTASLGAAVAGLNFFNSSNPATGNGPELAAIGDFNGDGKLDLVVPNNKNSANTLTVLLGNGDGTFTSAAASPATGVGPYSVAVGDFNGDGKTDLAVANQGDGANPSTVTVLLGNGDGTFTPTAVSPATGVYPFSVAVGDFNGDGKADLAVANDGSESVTILLGNGDGTFTETAVSPTTGGSPISVAVGDFNGDGRIDLATANYSDNTVTVLLGNGDGTFTATPVSPPTGVNPYFIAVGDINGDGKADLFTANYSGNTVTVLLGNGDGTFSATPVSPATGLNPAYVSVTDLNGDGIADLAVANVGDNTLTILIGKGDGTFNPGPVPATGTAPASVVVGDFNGDGAPDLAASNFDSNTFTVLLAQRTQTATATLANVSVTAPPTSHNAVANYPGDMNFGPSISTPVVLTAQTGISTPTITSLNPNAVYVGSGDTLVTIAGTNFLTGATVTVNGTSQAATFISATQLTTTLTAAQLSTVATLTLAVVNPDGGTSLGAAFTVLPLPLQLTPPSLNFGSQAAGLTSAAQTVTVTNVTDAAIAITGIVIRVEFNPTDFGETNNCPATLPAGASCQVNVTFTPLGVGAKSSALEVDNNSPVQAIFVPISGVGTGGILQVNPGNLKTIAGTGTAGYSGDGGAAALAALNLPDGVAFDPSGNLYIADVANSVIRKVDASGEITTVAGTGTAGFSGDGGPATSAQLNNPFSVTVDSAGDLFIQDTGNARIRRVDATGMITTFAGTGTAGYSGDNGPATSAQLAENQGARFDSAGNLFVSDCGNSVIRKIDTSGIITTVAGNGTAGFSGDGGAATSAQLNCPSGVVVDAAGDFFIADYSNNRIREVNANGVITTIGGTGTAGFSGDNGSALSAELNIPNDVVLDAAGDLYIADSGNNRLRRIDKTGTITTVAGGLDNAGSAGINTPSAVTLDAGDNLYFSDTSNNAVREVFPAGALSFPTTPIGTAAASQTVTLSNIGNLPVTIASPGSFALSGNAGDFSLVGGTCLAAPAVLAASGGSCTLQIGFTPTAAGTRILTVSVTDTAVYSPQSFQIGGTGVVPSLANVIPLISPTATPVGSGDTTLTVTGMDFTATSVVNFNATALITTFVNSGKLTAIIPAAQMVTAGNATVTVSDATYGTTSQGATFTILPPASVTFSGPGVTNPGEQPPLSFQLQQQYPADLNGVMTLTFTPAPGNTADPQAQFATGGTSFSFTLPANTTAVPAVLVQVGTVAGTITITLQLSSGGVNVTPASVTPITIIVPKVSPTITKLSFSASGNTLTVLVTGYSSTREIQSATFNFNAAAGASLAQKTVTVPVATLYQTWYSTTGSVQYGSEFTYTQVFTLSGPATAVGGIGVTLTNSVGTSNEAAAQ